MTGRYLIYTPLECQPRVFYEGRRFLRNWHVFVETCRSLHRDGLDYSVEFNLTGANPHVQITAHGKAKPCQKPVQRRSTLPPPVPAQRCHEQVREVQWFIRKRQGKPSGCAAGPVLNWEGERSTGAQAATAPESGGSRAASR